MNPAINGSEPLDLQDVTQNPAAELQTLQRSRKPCGRGFRTLEKLAPNPSKKKGSVFIVKM